MTDSDKYETPKTGIHKYVRKHIKSLPDLSGKSVLDIPCGNGRSSYEFKKMGADVISLDLFPEFMEYDELTANYADLSDPLPIESNTVDYILCQEGIEHLSNQLFALQEFNRVLKKGGTLLITTPNYSHARARLSRFFIESDYWKRMPPTELDSIWFSEGNKDKLYFGHVFLLGVQHLQTLLSFTGFKVTKRIKTDIGNTSVFLGLLMYPLFILISILSYRSYRNKNSQVEQKKRHATLWERVKLNISPTTLFYKHIFWEIQKTTHLDKVISELKDLTRK